MAAHTHPSDTPPHRAPRPRAGKFTRPFPTDPSRYWFGTDKMPPIRHVTVDQTSRWLARGWEDMWAAPRVSLTYGLIFVVIAYGLFFGLNQLGMGSLILPLAAGFLLIAPLAAVGFYEVSRRHAAGQPVTLRDALATFDRNAQQLSLVGLTLMVVFLLWVTVAMLIFAVFYNTAPPSLDAFFSTLLTQPQAPLFLLVGSAAGGALAAGVFAISAISLPLLIDRDDIPAPVAMALSVRAVVINWRPMIGWAAMIALITGIGLVTFFVGLAITLPLIGHATWHAYKAMIE